MFTVLSDYNLQMHNTFRMNVKCNKWIEYTEAEDLPQILATLGNEQFKAIGEGSNLLFLNNFAGAILHSRILTLESSLQTDGTTLLRAGASINMDELIETTCLNGLWGMENLSGIPGEVGASAVQNVGAYGVEAKDVIDSVECYDVVDRKFVRFSNSDCNFSYRYSKFKDTENTGRYIVTYVTFRISSHGQPQLRYANMREFFENVADVTPMDVRNRILEIRNAKLPSVETVGSAGSFFKNPIINEAQYADFRRRAESLIGPDAEAPHFTVPGGIKLSAAWLIDKAGLKGLSIGEASTWPTQPLVIVNTHGNATPTDILNLENLIIEKVFQLFGVALSPEVEHIS